MSVDQFEEANEANQKWKYSNERTSESWQKVEATALQKIELRVNKGAVMMVHVLCGRLASSYTIQHAFLQHISWRVSVHSVISKHEFLQFHIKEWLDCCMDVCSSYEYSSDIGLERLSYQSKIISINIRISPSLSRENVKHAGFLKSP